jgi:hypothetical protein
LDHVDVIEKTGRVESDVVLFLQAVAVACGRFKEEGQLGLATVAN